MEPKERILEKANELFNRYGIRSVSMDDIATQVGMSKKTVYQYYTDKEELVTEVIEAKLATNKACCLQDKHRAENAVHEIFLAFDMIQELFSKMNPIVITDMEKYHPPAYQKFQDFRNGFLYQVISTNLKRGIAEELYRPEIDIDILTRLRIASVMLAFNTDVFPNNRTHLIHIERELTEHFLYGLATTKGQKLITKYKIQRTKNKN
jgi:AcrR family transcriptional regulator